MQREDFVNEMLNDEENPKCTACCSLLFWKPFCIGCFCPCCSSAQIHREFIVRGYYFERLRLSKSGKGLKTLDEQKRRRNDQDQAILLSLPLIQQMIVDDTTIVELQADRPFGETDSSNM